MPMFGETWVGQRGETTRLNGAACHISGTTRLKEAVFSATSPDQFTPHAYRLFDALSHACAARRFGGDCHSYGVLTWGHIDLILEAELQPYDVMLLVPVVTGAGGVITDWSGAPLTLPCGQVRAAAAPELHQAALDQMRQGCVPAKALG